MTDQPQPATPPTPVPVAILLCDQVITDEATKKKTIVGVFDRVWVRSFPTNYLPSALYVRLIDAEGEYRFRIEYVKVNDQTRLGQATGMLQAVDRHLPADFGMQLPPLYIPEPGEYEFRLWMNDRYIHRARFTARPAEERNRP